MEKEYISTFKSLKSREKTCPLSAIILKDIYLLYAPLFGSISFIIIGIIKKRAPPGVGHTFKGLMSATKLLYFNTLKSSLLLSTYYIVHENIHDIEYFEHLSG